MATGLIGEVRMKNIVNSGVKMRSLTGRIEMCEVILALLASGQLPLAARMAEQEELEDDT